MEILDSLEVQVSRWISAWELCAKQSNSAEDNQSGKDEDINEPTDPSDSESDDDSSSDDTPITNVPSLG